MDSAYRKVVMTTDASSSVQVPKTQSYFCSILSPSSGHNLFYPEQRDEAVRNALDRWGARAVVYTPTKKETDEAVIFDKPNGDAFAGSHLRLEDCGSVFVSQTYAEHHGLGGMLLPFRCVNQEQMHIIRELRGDTVLGWAVIRTGTEQAFKKYLAGYAQCGNEEPSRLEVISFNDRDRALVGRLDEMRFMIPQQSFSHVTLEAPPIVAKRIPAAWLVELRFV